MNAPRKDRYLAVGPTWAEWEAAAAERAAARPLPRPARRDDGTAVALRALARALGDEQPPCADDPGTHYVESVDATAAAVATCWRCPARAPCADLADALDERHGVWGATWRGNTRADRRRVPLPDPTTTTTEESA